ncbi:hypothetical protein LSAT2_017841, partial [Lamellibrachia satsuma]
MLYSCCNRFEADHPGKVFARVTSESDEDTFTMWTPDTHLAQSAPDAVVSAGLDPQRQWYLYNSIREFVKYVNKDPFHPTTDPQRGVNLRHHRRGHEAVDDVAQEAEGGVVSHPENDRTIIMLFVLQLSLCETISVE